MLVKQALYCLSHTSSCFGFGNFGDRAVILLFMLPVVAGIQAHTTMPNYCDWSPGPAWYHSPANLSLFHVWNNKHTPLCPAISLDGVK
jgi:hypothetical protein